jgi:hypothetical protein
MILLAIQDIAQRLLGRQMVVPISVVEISQHASTSIVFMMIHHYRKRLTLI